MPKHAIFLSGPIGAGKTTLGRALSERLSAGFIDGDDHSDPHCAWYCSILRTSRSIVRTGFAVLDRKPAVVIAYPLNCIGWVYFRRMFGDAGIRPLFVSLRASCASITHESRGRSFSDEEKRRIRAMIAEGYGAQPFSDLVIETGRFEFAAALAQLESEIRRLGGVPRKGGGR